MTRRDVRVPAHRPIHFSLDSLPSPATNDENGLTVGNGRSRPVLVCLARDLQIIVIQKSGTGHPAAEHLGYAPIGRPSVRANVLRARSNSTR